LILQSYIVEWTLFVMLLASCSGSGINLSDGGGRKGSQDSPSPNIEPQDNADLSDSENSKGGKGSGKEVDGDNSDIDKDDNEGPETVASIPENITGILLACAPATKAIKETSIEIGCQIASEQGQILFNYQGSATWNFILASGDTTVVTNNKSTDLRFHIIFKLNAASKANLDKSLAEANLKVSYRISAGGKVQTASGTVQEALATPITSNPACQTIAGSWVTAIGDVDYNTNNFCLMKYEAKQDPSNSPISVAEGAPWILISQRDSILECAAIGQGFHLITNDEWMTIAANAAGVAANWSGGAVGSGTLFRGHSDSSPLRACEANPDDSLAYVEGNCTSLGAGGGENDENTQKRTHRLADGTVIWDFSGNLDEWTSYFNRDDKPGSTQNTGSVEYDALAGSNTMPLSELIPTAAVKAFWNDNWNSTQSIGRFFPSNNGAGGAFARSGSFRNGQTTGLFYGDLVDTATSTFNFVGLRCTASLD
jgi:hypothetical protein